MSLGHSSWQKLMSTIVLPQKNINQRVVRKQNEKIKITKLFAVNMLEKSAHESRVYTASRSCKKINER